MTAVLDLVLLFAGLGIAFGCGLVGSAWDALRLAGAAYLLGVAAVGATVTMLLCAGLAMGVWLMLVVAAVAAGVGVAAGLLHGARPTKAPRVASRVGRRSAIITAVAALVLLAYLAILLRAAHGQGGTTAWDAWTFWVPKGKSIYFFHHLQSGPGGVTTFANPDYPPLVPAMDAAAFSFTGRAAPSLLPMQEWLLVVAFLWALGGLFWRRVAAPVLAVALLLVAVMPDLAETVGQSLADLPLSLLLATAAAFLALWMEESRALLLAPVAVLLAAVVETKKEGLSLAIVLLIAAAIASRSRRAAWLAVPAAFAVLSSLPWRLWLHAHHVVTSGDYQYHDLVSPHFLSSRRHRLVLSIEKVPQYLFSFHRWELVLPLALIAALLARRGSGVPLFVIATTALGLFGLIAIYWISLLPFTFHIQTSASRTVMPFVCIAGALLPLLLRDAAADQGAQDP